MAFLANSTFETGLQGWRAQNVAAAVQVFLIRDGSARSGKSFLRVRTSQPEGSVACDFTLGNYTASGDQFANSFQIAATRSIGALIYLRAAPGGPAVAGQLKLWALGEEALPINDNGTNFVAGNDWALVACALDGTAFSTGSSHPTIRIEIYVETTNASLDVDTVIVC